MSDATQEQNMGMWASFISSTASDEYKYIKMNRDLFNRMVVPACF